MCRTQTAPPLYYHGGCSLGSAPCKVFMPKITLAYHMICFLENITIRIPLFTSILVEYPVTHIFPSELKWTISTLKKKVQYKKGE